MVSLWKKNKAEVQTQKDMVYSMVRILAQNQGDVLYELLAIMEPLYGAGSVLSIVISESKEILATTKEDSIEAIRHTAYGVKDAANPHTYIREERNAMYFRVPFQYIQVIPIRSIGKNEAFLMVEQEYLMEPYLDRCFEVLEIATRMQMYEYLAKKNREIDRKTLLGTRDMLVERMKICGKQDTYLGVFSLLNGNDIGLAQGLAGFDRAMLDMAEVLRNAFDKNCYLLADARIGVLVKGTVFEAAAALQSCLDIFVERHPLLKVGAVLSPYADEVYRIMYLCEKASDSCSVDAVLVIRNSEDFLNTGGEIVEMIYNGRTREEGKEAFQKPPGENKESEGKPEAGLHGDGEYIQYVFETGFDKMDLFEGL